MRSSYLDRTYTLFPSYLVSSYLFFSYQERACFSGCFNWLFQLVVLPYFLFRVLIAFRRAAFWFLLRVRQRQGRYNEHIEKIAANRSDKLFGFKVIRKDCPERFCKFFVGQHFRRLVHRLINAETFFFCRFCFPLSLDFQSYTLKK